MTRLYEWELNSPYAIIQYYSDLDWNDNISTIAIIQTKEEYDELIKELNDIQIDTGTSYHILYKKDKNAFKI